MTPRNRLARTTALLLTALLAACGGSKSSAPSLTGINVTPATVSLQVGATRQLAVIGTYSDGSTAPVTADATFTSDAPAKATVTSPGGLVTAVAAGTAHVTATVAGRTSATTVTVTAAPPTLASIAIAPDPASVSVGATLQLTVTGTYSDSSTADLTAQATFQSSAADKATVSSPGGLVTGVAEGATTVTATAGGKTATRDVAVTPAAPPPAADAIVFWDAYGTDVAFRDFGGAANDVTIDPAETFNGRHVVKFAVTGSGGYSGGAWVTSTPRDLTAYDALTFWAKASVEGKAIDVTGFGNDAGAGVGTGFPTERAQLPLTTAWQKFTVPVPDPAKFTNVAGLFHLAEAPEGYTIFFADVIFEDLGLATGAATINLGNAAPSLAAGGTTTIDPGQTKVEYTLAGDPQGTFTLKPVASGFLGLASADTNLVTVNDAGVITGVAAGGPVDVTATLRGVTAAGKYSVTVTGGPVAPTTRPPLPAPPAGAQVISLYASQAAAGFAGATVTDASGNVDTWRTCWSAGTGGDPVDVVEGGTTARPRRYDFTPSAVFAGVEFIGKTGAAQPGSCGGTITGANELDVTGMSHFHIDVWTPDANNVQVKLVDAGADGQLTAPTDANATLNGLNPPAFGTGRWLSYDIPLEVGPAAFQNGNWVSPPAGLAHLAQMIFTVPNGGTIYVDNIYFYKAPAAAAFANVTFDDPAVTYALSGFGGCQDSAVEVDPAGGPNQVARITKNATAEVWGGATVVTQTGNRVGKIPFAAGRTTMTLRVYAPAAGLPVMLKVEDGASNGGIFVEVTATTTTANAWETLTFSYAAANLASTYDRVSVFPNFGTSGATAGAQTWYVDDLTLLP